MSSVIMKCRIHSPGSSHDQEQQFERQPIEGYGLPVVGLSRRAIQDSVALAHALPLNLINRKQAASWPLFVAADKFNVVLGISLIQLQNGARK